MEYKPSAKSSESLQLNPSSLMKYVVMLVPTPSKYEITSKRIFSEIVEIEDEDQDSTKKPSLDSGKELVESKENNMKEKGKVQSPILQIQEYTFVEAQEVGSSDKYKSRNDLYTKYGQDKKSSSEKYLNLFVKVRDISDKYVSLITVKYHVGNNFNLALASHDKVSKMRINLQKIPVLDKIHLYKKARDVIYIDLLKAT